MPPAADGRRAEFALFSTAIGRCGIAWSDTTILATHLPERNDTVTAARLAARSGGAAVGAPPLFVRQAIEAVTALLGGARADLSFIACDFSALDRFSADVYRLTRAIPPGETTTYGEIATKLGDRHFAQAVGQALGRNPFPILVPCHRVLGAKGRLTGFSADGGVETKLRMLTIEGAQLGESPALFGDLPLVVKPAKGS